jgi:hypothetical protein
MENEQYLAQVGHAFGALSVVLVSALFALATATGWQPVAITFGIGILLAAAKEFLLDVNKTWGEGDSWGDSLMDFAFYVLGGAIGLGLTAWAFHLASGRIVPA